MVDEYNVIKKFELTINEDTLKDYEKYYFSIHTKAHKKPIEHPYHPSINIWFIMQRPQMNDLKQKWKDFIIWWIKDLCLENIKLDSYVIRFTTFMPTKRRYDPDNSTPKFIMDGFTEAGFIIDDDGEHCKELQLRTRYDKDNPRTEIEIWQVL